MEQHHHEHPRYRMRLGWLLLWSYVIYTLGYIIDQTCHWSNHLNGFVNGVIHTIPFSIVWVIFLLPWSLLIHGLYRWRRWKRFRTAWVLGLPILSSASVLLSLVMHPPTPNRRFQHFAHATLPQEKQDIHYHFIGGGFADYYDRYYFRATPEAIGQLIVDMKLPKRLGAHQKINPLPDCPDPATWQESAQYQADDGHWFYDLQTNPTQTEVYLLIGCI